MLNGGADFRVKLVGKLLPQVISRVWLMGIMGTPFSHRYLKFSLLFEKFRDGTMKSPVMVLVSITLDLRSFAEDTFRVYCSYKSPFFMESALNWNMNPCLLGIDTRSGKIWKMFSSSV